MSTSLKIVSACTFVLLLIKVSRLALSACTLVILFVKVARPAPRFRLFYFEPKCKRGSRMEDPFDRFKYVIQAVYFCACVTDNL